MTWTARLLLAGVFLVGLVFALQGLRLLPSRLMYGRPEWLAIGAAMMLGSLAGLWLTRRS